MKKRNQILSKLQDLGFTWDEANTLRRISMTLHRWGELECGDGNDYASWAIERDETTGKPFMVTYPHDGKPNRRAIADRETGALKRLQAILNKRNERNASPISFYHQTDPRGCSLYLIRQGDIPQGSSVESCYTNGVAVCD